MAIDSNQDGGITNLNYLMLNRSKNYSVPLEPGGVVILASAAAAVLNTGDCVYMTATGANKSATGANYFGFLGVVVGGKLSGNEVIYGTGFACTTGVAGEDVLIQISGIATVVAGGTITVGTNFSVIPDTGTAGRVIAGTTAGQVLGKALGSASVGTDVKILIGHR